MRDGRGGTRSSALGSILGSLIVWTFKVSSGYEAGGELSDSLSLSSSERSDSSSANCGGSGLARQYCSMLA